MNALFGATAVLATATSVELQIWIVLLQKSCIDVSVLLIDRLHRSDPFPLVVGAVVGSRTMIYAEGFGTELVGTELVFLNVGFPVSAMG